jgi:hypothetical protein
MPSPRPHPPRRHRAPRLLLTGSTFTWALEPTTTLAFPATMPTSSGIPSHISPSATSLASHPCLLTQMQPLGSPHQNAPGCTKLQTRRTEKVPLGWGRPDHGPAVDPILCSLESGKFVCSPDALELNIPGHPERGKDQKTASGKSGPNCGAKVLISQVFLEARTRLNTETVGRVFAGRLTRVGVTPLAGTAKFSAVPGLSGPPLSRHTCCTPTETRYRETRNQTAPVG